MATQRPAGAGQARHGAEMLKGGGHHGRVVTSRSRPARRGAGAVVMAGARRDIRAQAVAG